MMSRLTENNLLEGFVANGHKECGAYVSKLENRERLKYEKPKIVKNESMRFPLDILKTQGDFCVQCSSCHSCR